MEERRMSHPRPPSASALLDREHIARRAYEIYLERGRLPGHELDDWLRAEHELAQRADELLAKGLHN